MKISTILLCIFIIICGLIASGDCVYKNCPILLSGCKAGYCKYFFWGSLALAIIFWRYNEKPKKETK
jgi:hypothetical protein